MHESLAGAARLRLCWWERPVVDGVVGVAQQTSQLASNQSSGWMCHTRSGQAVNRWCVTRRSLVGLSECRMVNVRVSNPVLELYDPAQATVSAPASIVSLVLGQYWCTLGFPACCGCGGQCVGVGIGIGTPSSSNNNYAPFSTSCDSITIVSTPCSHTNFQNVSNVLSLGP